MLSFFLWCNKKCVWAFFPFVLKYSWCIGIPGGSDGKESACNVGDLGFDSWVEKIPWRRESSILAWRIPQTVEPGWLQSMGPQRVGCDWATNTHTHVVDLQSCVINNLKKCCVSFRLRGKWFRCVCVCVYILFHCRLLEDIEHSSLCYTVRPVVYLFCMVGSCRASLVAQWWRVYLPLQETPVRSLGWEISLEKEMAIHSSICAWKIPWTEDPGRLQAMGSQKSQTALSN